VGVDYRILSVGNGLIRRGLGRFTQQQLRAVLAVDGDNEYALICPPGADRFLIDPVVRRAPNVSVLHLPVDLVPTIGDGWASRLQRAEQFQQWVVDQGIDLFHATTPFYPCEPMLSSFDACPMVATFYDAIPLLYPAHYFLGPADKSIYAFAMSILRSATRVLAISDASRQDAVDLVGVPRDRIDLAYPSVDSIFGVLAPRDVDRMLARLSRRVRIPTRFAFTVSFPHHSKNMDNLLLAYSRLPDAVRLRLPLVAACTVPEAATIVWPLARALGITDDIVLTGPLTDEELVALYNRATFVVHPSRYEGFGLPVAEAMRCGTAVITTTSSSLPEIAGGAALLVDPDDVDAMAAAMLTLDSDEAMRDELVERGLVQSARFDEDQLAAATLDCYRRAVAAATEPRRPRLAVWSPLPPEGGSSARTTTELLDELAAICDVEVFVGDGAQPGWSALGRRPVHHRSAFDRRLAQAGFDALVYSLDGTPAHAYVREAVAAHPGIAVVHSVSDVVDAALACIVHDPVVSASLSRRYPGAEVLAVPLGVADPGEDLAVRRKAARADLGADDSTFVVALFAEGATDAARDSARRAVAMLDDAVLLAEDGIAACDVAVVVPTGHPASHEGEVRALAAGRPVVHADARAASGYDTTELVAELRALQADPDRRAARGSEARARFEHDHALPHAATAYLDAIAAVTGRTIERRPDADVRRPPDPWDEIVAVLGG
jgi:glycosyltransferase involved in cell wall biosynthesis